MEEYRRDFKGVWIPREVWLNRELSLTEKVFLVEINSLDNIDGCYASNKYFSEFFDLTRQRSSQVINKLKEKGYISIEYEREGKEVKKRIIRVLNKIDRGIKNNLQGYQENVNDPIKNNLEGYQINAKESNTLLNNTSNSNTTDQSSAELTERFEKLWGIYPRKIGKKKALASYKKAIKSGTTDEEIRVGIENYNKQIEIKNTDPKFIKHGSTWFNNESWNDDYETTNKTYRKDDPHDQYRDLF